MPNVNGAELKWHEFNGMPFRLLDDQATHIPAKEVEGDEGSS